MFDVPYKCFKTDYPTYIIYELHLFYRDRTDKFIKVVEKDIHYRLREREHQILELLKKKI